MTLQLGNKHDVVCQAKERRRSGHKWPFCSNEQSNYPHLKQQMLYFSPENYYFCVKRENAAAVDGPNTVVTSPLPSRLSIHHN